MELDAAEQLIEKAIAAGRPAHGYLVVGNVRGQALALAERVAAKLLGALNAEQLKVHPDCHWLHPEKKSRIISVAAMHEKMVDAVATTAYAGGWKVGVIAGADCLNPQSANAFLKTLEEPPKKTLFFLLADSPDQLLPTIVSRCQRIDLPDARRRGLAEPYRSCVLRALADPANAGGALERAALAGRLAAVLEALKDEVEKLVKADVEASETDAGAEVSKDETEALVSSRYRAFRADFCLTLENWFRDVAATCAAGPDAPLLHPDFAEQVRARAAKINRALAFRNVEFVAELARSFNRNLPEAAALGFFADRLAIK